MEIVLKMGNNSVLHHLSRNLTSLAESKLKSDGEKFVETGRSYISRTLNDHIMLTRCRVTHIIKKKNFLY